MLIARSKQAFGETSERFETYIKIINFRVNEEKSKFFENVDIRKLKEDCKAWE